jgi:hypothetical protein
MTAQAELFPSPPASTRHVIRKTLARTDLSHTTKRIHGRMAE